MNANTDPPIKSTALSFEIIEAIRDLDGATLPEIVDRFQKPKSTVHDHLTTLTELGYLFKEGRTFHVSPRFLSLGGYARSRTPLFQVAEAEVHQLANDTGEHANLMIEENGYGIFLHKVKGTDSVNLDTYEGMEVHLHTTAMGKAILAHVSDEERERLIGDDLPAVTENTITDRDTLDEELAEIRERGYAIDNEERLTGIRCIAAPIITGGEVVGAISVSGPKSRMAGERFENEIPSEVLSTANIIEVNLQHT